MRSHRRLLALLVPLGALVYWRGRQYAAARARAENIITPSKAHVLYLRTFETDRSFTILDLFDIRSPVWGVWKTDEEHLADALRPLGDFIAIGQPNSLPNPGAARIYTSDEEWKEVVKRQMQAAQLVVIRAGSGENVIWELTQAINMLNPQKLLILVWEMWMYDYVLFCTRVNSVLPVPLPAPKLLWGLKPRSGFIGFAEDWKPSFFPLRGPQYSLAGRFKHALKPVFESFSLGWQAPRVSVARVAAALFGIAIVLGIVSLILDGWLRPTFNTEAFKDSKAQAKFMKDFADACKLANSVSWCDCRVRKVVEVISVQEVEAVKSGHPPDSLREKIKRVKC